MKEGREGEGASLAESRRLQLWHLRPCERQWKAVRVRRWASVAHLDGKELDHLRLTTPLLLLPLRLADRFPLVWNQGDYTGTALWDTRDGQKASDCSQPQ